MDCKNDIKIGATLSIDITRVSGTQPVPLVNTQIASQLRHNKFGVYDMDVIMVNSPNGEFTLLLSADDTANMPAGDYQWDVMFTDADGTVEIFPKNGNVILTFVKGATRND